MRGYLSGACALALLVGAGSASAGVLNVDFGGYDSSFGGSGTLYTGLGALPDSGTYWNEVKQGLSGQTARDITVENLLASDGTTVTTIDVRVQCNYGFHENRSARLVDENPAYVNLFADFFAAMNDTTGTVTVSGLDAGQTYELYVYRSKQGRGDTPRGTDDYPRAFTVQGVTKLLNDDEVNTDPLTLDEDYAIFSAVADGAGSLQILFHGDGVTGHIGDIGGFQIQAVPEPASLAMLGLGAVALLRRRRA